ncbi:hypothetical protein FGKAn22_13910 [Ferrigenium kumadai]|uniref:Uncharacterized protein n=1 Tax=Ferrigenium kumadai TaxID=1682490 RepID=A0AAN1SZ76_9PROT|nr:hypothetical protein FGKAn22_13910 [Ferrigenium kumadai]
MLTPDQVLLARIGRSVTWRGVKRLVLEKKSIPCANYAGSQANGGDVQGMATQWGAAIQTLEATLAKQAGRKAFATVILSNHFMRYVLLPWSDVPGDEIEELAYARHAFRQAYGDAAETWDLRLSPGKIGMPQLASAVDPRLPEALRALFGRNEIALESIQPHLMAAYNTCQNILDGRSAWFVLVEPGSLCLALLREGHWESVRTMRLDGDGRAVLPLILERESFLAESATAIDEVFLWAPWLGNVLMPKSKRWKFWKLQPLLRAGLVPEPDARFAAALSGCA